MAATPIHNPSQPMEAASPLLSRLKWQFVVGGILYAIALGLVVNWSLPWESDQPAKAAQILEIANRHDYLISDAVPGCYRLRMFPFYYSASALLYSVTGGDIFAFMNFSSAAMGVVAGLSLAWAFYNVFKIAPIWTLLTLICMPLFVITYTYGNEAAWSVAFFCLSLALVSSTRRGLHYAGGAAVAISLFCRPDVVLLAPYWLAWTMLFCKSTPGEPWLLRVFRPASVFVLTAIALWLLLVRQIPETETAFEFNFNLKLMAGFLSYPFNLSVVLLGAIGWLVLVKQHRAYAAAHLLLLVPFAFYARNLSSPKYIVCLLIFYLLPAVFLIDRVKTPLRAAMLALVAVWFFVGVSVFGVFGPRASSLWYLPSVDGPCPIGGYLGFYARAHAGDYQRKQAENISQFGDFLEFAKIAPGHYWIAGNWPLNSRSLFWARGEFGTPEQQARVESICNAPGSLGREQPNDGSRIVMFRTGYISQETLHADLAQRVRSWLDKGQFRPVGGGASDVLPTVIEIGDHIPAGDSRMLGQRILFAVDYYHSHMIFEQPEFIAPYRPTSWVPASAVAAVDAEPIYRDAEVAVYDRPVEGAKILSYVWPADYYKLSAPPVKFHGRQAE